MKWVGSTYMLSIIGYTWQTGADRTLLSVYLRMMGESSDNGVIIRSPFKS
ncbi:MAG: hypothetical protein NTZ57_00275 [Deltaproteobacteria bacterium]|nr:hypothetical protein [Deltaproteobacteria bacterium]